MDSSGNAYLTGFTQSITFPTMNPYQGIYKGYYTDAFVTMLNPEGNALVYSTFLGGSSGDEGRKIAIDSNGRAYVTGRTVSTDFPTLNPLQATKAGYYDAFVTELSPEGNALDYSTYLGGSEDDEGLGIAVDSSGNAYVTGSTESSDFPTQNPYQGTFGGLYDAFVTKLNPGGNALVYSTYLGGSSDDNGFGVAVDGNSNAYVTGYTNSANFPTQNPYQSTNAGGDDAFVAVLSSSDLVPGISLIKMTNGEDANSPPGPYISVGGKVTWTYEVTNTGNVDLTNIEVTDDILGPIGTIPLLSPGQNEILTATGVASAGQYSNLGSAIGTTPSGSEVSDQDPSHYYSESANPISIDIDGTASEKWIDPYSSNTNDKEAVIWYEIAPNDFSGQVKIEIQDKDLREPRDVKTISATGGRHSLIWDGLIANEYVNQANNPYYLSLILQKDGQEVARSDKHRVWVGRPMILAHGLWSSKEKMETHALYRELKQSFFTVSVEYNGGVIGSSKGDIRQYAERLKNEIDEIKLNTGAKKVDIVAHSMGGLVARWHIQKSGTGDVGKLIMIAAPNHGSDLANLPEAALKFIVKKWFAGDEILKRYSLSTLIDVLFEKSNVAVFELATHSQFMKELNNNDACAYRIEKGGEYDDELSKLCRYSVVTSEFASDYWIPTLTHVHIGLLGVPLLDTFWGTIGDGVVPYFSSMLSDVSSYSEGDSFHNFQVESPEIINRVSSLLQQTDDLIQHNSSLHEDVQIAPNTIPISWTTPIDDLIHPNEIKSYNVTIDSLSTIANFMAVWDNGSLNVTLSAPNGTRIEIPSADGYAYYSIQDPNPGCWIIEISPNNIPLNGTNITIQAFIENPLFIGVNIDKIIFDPQEPIKITAYLGDNQSGFAGAFAVANISKPDNSTETVILYDDGLHNDNETADGIYSNQYMNTSLWGTYRIVILASGNTHGNDFERQIITTVWVELYPDLTLNTSDIYFSNSTPIAGENITLTAEIRNIGDVDAENSSILFYDNDPASGILIGEDVINISKGSIEKAEVVWEATPGQHEIYVLISPYNSFLELNYSNNMANKSINVSLANNSCISGTKFNDTNSNATREPGEAGLPGWTIRLTRPDGTTINATTDASGAYKFENLTSGTYRVSEISQSNWTQTYPAWLGDHIINITDGNVTGVDFGNNYLPAPEIPFPPSGPASGIPGAEYSYSTSSTDPSGYQIAYTFDWGDGSNSTTGLFDSGAVASAAHFWNSSGIYQVRAMATNSKGASSGWSAALEVDIAAGIAADKIGVFRNGPWYIDYNGNKEWDPDSGDVSFWFGTGGDLPFAGDWSGDDVDEIGVFRNGPWYIDHNGNRQWDPDSGDVSFWFGTSGDFPIAGDWNGDGRDEIGVFRNGPWYLDYNGNRVWDPDSGDVSFWFGTSGDLPIAGDWNGDGKDEIGVFRNGPWYLDYNGNREWDPASGDVSFWFGTSGDAPLAGDWNSDGIDEIGVFRNGPWYLDYNGNREWDPASGDVSFWFGTSGDRPVEGRWGSLSSSLGLDNDKTPLDLSPHSALLTRSS